MHNQLALPTPPNGKMVLSFPTPKLLKNNLRPGGAKRPPLILQSLPQLPSRTLNFEKFVNVFTVSDWLCYGPDLCFKPSKGYLSLDEQCRYALLSSAGPTDEGGSDAKHSPKNSRWSAWTRTRQGWPLGTGGSSWPPAPISPTQNLPESPGAGLANALCSQRTHWSETIKCRKFL